MQVREREGPNSQTANIPAVAPEARRKGVESVSWPDHRDKRFLVYPYDYRVSLPSKETRGTWTVAHRELNSRVG